MLHAVLSSTEAGCCAESSFKFLVDEAILWNFSNDIGPDPRKFCPSPSPYLGSQRADLSTLQPPYIGLSRTRYDLYVQNLQMKDTYMGSMLS